MMPTRQALKRARTAKGLTVSDMARMHKISASFYYKIEQGVRNPNLQLARSIARTLDCPVDELFFASELDDSSNNQAAALDAS